MRLALAHEIRQPIFVSVTQGIERDRRRGAEAHRIAANHADALAGNAAFGRARQHRVRRIGGNGNEVAPLILAEKPSVSRDVGGNIDGCSETTGQRHLRQRDGDTAV